VLKLTLVSKALEYDKARNIDVLKGVQDLRAPDVNFVYISLSNRIPLQVNLRSFGENRK